MGFKFNPFSGTFDATGASDAAPFAGQVDAYADLPLDSTAALNSRWLVKNNSGTWPFSTYKQAGIYIRVNTVGASRDNDYQFVGTLPSVMNDNEFLIYDDADATKNLKFNVGTNVPTASTVTLTAPGASGTLGWLQSVSSITVSTDHQLTAARNQRVRVNSTNIGSGAVVYLPAANNAEGDRLEVACVGLAAGTLSVRTGQYDYTVSTSMGLNEQRTFIYTAGAWTVGTVESHTHAGLGPTFASSAFQVTEPSGIVTNRLAFSLSGITAGATRTLTVPDNNGTIALTSNFAAPPAIGSTTPAAATFTNLSANTRVNLPNTNGTTAGDLYRNANTLRYRDSTNTERLLLNATDNLSNLADTATARANLGLGTSDNVTFGSIQNTPIGSTTPAAGSFSTLNATGTTELVNGGTTAGPFRLYNISSAANANFERLSLRWASNVAIIGTEKAGTGSARALEFQTDGVTRMRLTTDGTTQLTGSLQISNQTVYTLSSGGGFSGFTVTEGTNRVSLHYAGITIRGDGYYGWGPSINSAVSADTTIRRVSAGLLQINADTAGTYRDLVLRALMVGGTTASFPALRNSSTTLQVRLADDTAFAPLECAGLTLNGNLTASTRNIVTDTTTGTRIGTGTTQLLGFWNAAPSAQPAAVADATDAATVITQLNALLSRLRTIGLIAT